MVFCLMVTNAKFSPPVIIITVSGCLSIRSQGWERGEESGLKITCLHCLGYEWNIIYLPSNSNFFFFFEERKLTDINYNCT
jgi:hypothetical protein